MSSSSSYSQGLPTCLEPARLVDPRVSRLKLAPPKSNISPSHNDSDCDPKSSSSNNNNNNNNAADVGGWSFLQSLTKKSNTENDKIYTPPSFKRSSSKLSGKSLEMCTESLGSETGSDGSDSSDEMSFPVLESSHLEARERSNLRAQTRRITRNVSFPPPLTTISSSNISVQVRPHREDGRLVLKAVSISSHCCFHAERADGRLRLNLMKDFHSEEEEEEEEEEKEEEEAEEEEHEVDQEEDEVVDESVGGEMGMGKLPQPSRCKEGGSRDQGLLNNWELFWVAT